MSLLESVTGVTPASMDSVSFTVLAPVTNTINSDSTSSFPGQTETMSSAAGLGLALPTEGATIPSGYPRRASLLWTLILSTSISSVDPEASRKVTRKDDPFPGTPHSLHHLNSDVSNSSVGDNFGTSLKISKNNTPLRGISKKTSDVLDPGNSTTQVSLNHEQDGEENARQAKNFTTSRTLGSDEMLSFWTDIREDEVVNDASSLSLHSRNSDVALQPDDGKLMKGFSPSTAAPLTKTLAPRETVTGDVVTAAHLLDLNVESFRTTAREPKTFPAFLPPSGAILTTTTDSSQVLIPSDQISGDISEVLTVSAAPSSPVDIQYTTVPSRNEQDAEAVELERNSNEFTFSSAQNNSDLAEVSSINTNNFDSVTSESETLFMETSEFSVLEVTTEPGDFEKSMPQSLDSDLEMVEPLLSGLATLDLDQTTKTIKAVTQPFEKLLPSIQQWELVEPEPSYVDTIIPEPINVDAGLPELQNLTSMSPESQNEEAIIPDSQKSNLTFLKSEELEIPRPERNNDEAPDVPSFHITEIVQNVSERFAGNWGNETLNATRPDDPQQTPDPGIHWTTSRILLLIIQFVIMVETVLGNLMVILSVKMEKKLQTPFNFYIVNLAFTDMNVGLSVMSLFMVYNLYDYFPFSSFLCDYWIWSDYTMTFESVMTLAAISLDRLWSVTWSLHYRNHNSGRKSVAIILATWCLVALIWLPPFVYDRVTNTYSHGDCYWDTVLNKNLVVYVGCLGYYSPLLVMLGAYARILWVVRKRAASIRDAGRKQSIGQPTESSESGTGVGESSRGTAPHAPPRDDRRQEAKLRREMKAVYTLLNIVVIFLICWVPFYTLFVLSAWFPTLFPTWYVTFSYWMAYINSALNPILYPLSSPEFRAAYKHVLHSIMCRK